MNRCRFCNEETENFVVHDIDGDHFYCGRGSCADALKHHNIEARKRRINAGVICSFDETGVGPCGRPSVTITPSHGRCIFHNTKADRARRKSTQLLPAISR